MRGGPCGEACPSGGARGHPHSAFEAPFLDTLGEEYGAGVRLLDFATSAEPARAAINGWVAEVTRGLITGLLPAGTIDLRTRFVIVNAVTVRAAWASPFDPAHTADGAFHLADGSSVTASFMRRTDAPGKIGEVGDVQVASLPYDGGELSMVFLVPPAGELDAFETALTAERLDALAGALEPAVLDVSVPRFEVHTALRLDEALDALAIARSCSSCGTTPPGRCCSSDAW